MLKRCRKCLQTLPLTDFVKSSQTLDGFHVWCNRCKAASLRAARARHPERTKATRRRNYLSSHTQILAHHRATYQRQKDNPDFQKTNRRRARQWAIDHPEQRRQQQKQKYQRDRLIPERVERERAQSRAAQRRRRIENPLMVRQKQAQWRKNNPELVLANRRRFYLKNRDRYYKISRLRRALLRQVQVAEPVSLDILYARDKGICSLCHTKVTRQDASMDHIIPLSKGGEHSYRNTALAHLRCNLSKGNRVKVQQLRLF